MKSKKVTPKKKASLSAVVVPWTYFCPDCGQEAQVTGTDTQAGLADVNCEKHGRFRLTLPTLPAERLEGDV